MYSRTVIKIRDEDQCAFEVYADETKGQTIGFCFDEKIAEYLARYKERIITPEVVIEVLGGVAHLEVKSVGVQVTIIDHDNKSETEEYSEEIWDESDGV